MLASIAVALIRRRFAEATAACFIFVGASVVTQVLKHEVIARPDLAGALFAAPTRLRFVLAPALVVWAAAAGMGVIAAGWHRPSDVVTASLVVGFWCSIAALMVSAARRRRGLSSVALTTAQRRLRGLTPVLILLAAITAIALCASYASGSERALASALLTVATIIATGQP